ncbi:MAG: Rpn family recombination-promoting nuclease/putative transposase [Cyanobacterium sp.]
MSYDSVLKFIIDEYTAPILTWLFNQEITDPVEMLNTELNIEPIRADGVFFLQVGEKIIHLEFQTRPKSEPPLPLRMLDYWVRLYRTYKLYQTNTKIEQVIIFLQKTKSIQAYQNTFEVDNTIHRYQVVRIWECDATPLLSQPELLPLAVLAKNEQPEILLSQVAERISRIEDKRKKSNITACVELLAGINYSEELIKMYLQDDLLKESVTYQRIIREGMAEGIQQGIQQGIQEGIQQGLQQGIQQGVEEGEKEEAIALVFRLTKKRFPESPDTLKNDLKTLSVEQLETLAETLFDVNSFDEVVQWLDSNK